jgi:FkbM family methyltransferase
MLDLYRPKEGYSPGALATRAISKLWWEWVHLSSLLLLRDPVTCTRLARVSKFERIGSGYGGWRIPAGFLDKHSTCYCAGIGEDISFDLGVIKRYGCHVHGFDPTPRAKRFVERVAASNDRYHYHECGLWDSDEVLKFYAPSDSRFVSHSAVNLQKTTQYFQAPCKRISTFMRDLGHRRIDLLKIDIEGAEYRVLRSVVEERLDIGIICVEYDEIHNALDAGYRDRIRESVRSLVSGGYAMVATQRRCNYTFASAAELTAPMWN